MFKRRDEGPRVHRRWSLRGRLHLMMAGVALVVLSATAYETYVEWRAGYRATVERVLNLAQASAVQAERILKNYKLVLGELARHSGDSLTDVKQCEAVLSIGRSIDPAPAGISRFDENGHVVCSHESWRPPDQWLGARHQTSQSGGPGGAMLGRPQRSAALGSWVVPLSLGVSNADGGPSGVVIAALDLVHFKPLGLGALLPAGGYITIVDGEGYVIARSTDGAKSIGERAADLLSIAELRRLVGDAARARGEDSVERIYGASEIRGSDWLTIVAVPVDSVRREVWKQASRYVLFVSAVFLSVGIMALYLRRRIERPIAALAAAARAVSAGCLEVRATEDGSVELAEVGKQFNAMLDTLSTERKASEETQIKLQNVLRAVEEVVYSMTPDIAQVNYVSAAVDRVFGRGAEEFYADPGLWLEAIHEDDRNAVSEALKKLQEGHPLNIEYRIRRADGTQHWLHDRAWLIRDADGQPSRIDGVAMDVTSRKLAESALREREQHFRAIAESSPIPLLVAKSPESTICFVNEAFQRFFQIPWNDCVGRFMGKFFVGLEGKGPLHEVLRRKSSFQNVEVPLRHDDGRVSWVMASSRLASFDGGPAHYVGIYDITARKQAEQSLAAGQERFRTLVAALGEGVVMLDASGCIVACNTAAEEVLGLSRDHLLGMSAYDNRWEMADENGVQFTAECHPISRTLASGTPQRDAIVGLRRADGRLLWLSLNAQPLFHSGAAKPYAAVFSFNDITSRKQAERALLDSEAKLVGIIASAMDAVITVDAGFRVSIFNPAAEAMFGYSAAEMQGAPLDRLLPKRLQVKHESYMSAFAGSGAKNRRMSATARAFGLRRSGEEFPIEASISQLESGGQHLFTAILRDITERVKAEDAIQQLNESLERRVIERTAELEQAIKELEAFSYSVSHDLSAPLRAINGFAHILQDCEREVLSTEGKELLERIRRNAERMGQLIDDILRFSRVSRADLSYVEVNMVDLARAVSEELRETFPGTAIEMKPMPAAIGDPAMLRQVWVNLIGNALKFSAKKAQPRIEIGSLSRDGETLFYVKDNGAGFDLRYSHRLFGVFQRMHSGEEFPGTGVGLAIVKRIIERHKGHVWADAAVNQGATFYFTILT